MNELESLADEGARALRSTVGDLRTLKGWHWSTLKKAFQILPEIVKKVEVLCCARNLKGPQKQELGILILEKLIPTPSWLPRAAFRALIGMAIDLTVAALKDRFPQ